MSDLNERSAGTPVVGRARRFALVRIALRNVLRNRRRSLITLSAVFIALTVMVTVRGMLNGLQASIKESIIYGQTGAVLVHRSGFLKAMQGGLELDVPSDEAFLARITAVPGVTAAAPRIPFGGMVNANDTTVFSMFMALDPAREEKVCPRRFEKISTGAKLDGRDPTGADFTRAILQMVGAKLGDKVALLTGDRDGVLNAVEVSLRGSFPEEGIIAADKKFGFLPLGVAQELLRMPGRATEIGVGIARLDEAEAVAARVQAALGSEYEVVTWKSLASFVDDVIQAQNGILNVISYIFLFMALLGILNTMLMSVRERTREIGTMMAVGVRRRQILGMFLLEAGFIGLGGAIAGSVVGGSIVHHWGAVGLHIRIPGGTSIIELFPFITASFIAGTFVLATVGAAGAALLPALLASRLRPVEALTSV